MVSYLPGPVGNAAVQAELRKIAEALARSQPSVTFQTKYSEPERVADGLVVKADGTRWDPGSGEGLYMWFADEWHPLSGAGLVEDAIVDGVTTKAPSQNAVFDALALKAPLASPALTGTPTAPTPSASDNSTKIATTAYVDAAVAGAGGSPTSGGATSSGSVTLTSSSKQAQKLGPTAHGNYVKLPNATTMTKGGALFMLGNPTAYWVRIFDSTNVLRGFVPPYGNVAVSLADSSTAAGGWLLDGSAMFGITGMLHSSDLSRNCRAQFLELDANRTLIVFATAGTGTISGVVYDESDQTWGSVTAIRSGALFGPYLNSVILSTDFVLVASCNGSTALEAVPVTISGKTISVGTAGTATLGGTIITLGDMIVLGSSAVLSYARASNTAGLRAITISGTTATIGSEVTTSTTSNATTWEHCPHLYAVTSSVVLALGAISNSSTGYAKPYTLSGSTLTLGTGTTFGTVINNNQVRTLSWGSRWLVLWCEGASGSTLSAASISMSGTVASATVVTSVITSLAASFSPYLVVDVRLISSTKALVTAINSSAFRANIVADASGTISKGTEYNPQLGNGTYTSHAIMSVSGNDARVYLPATAGQGRIITLDCSSTAPVVTIGEALHPAANPAQVSYAKEVVRHPALMRCGGGWAFVQGSASTGLNTPVVVGASEAFELQGKPPTIWAQQANVNVAFGVFNPTCSPSDYATWQFIESSGNLTFFTVMKIEGAQP